MRKVIEHRLPVWKNRLAGESACPTLARTGFRFEWGRRFRLPTQRFNGAEAMLYTKWNQGYESLG